MPYYHPLRHMTSETRLRTIGNLQKLRRQLDQEFPPKTRDTTLVLGTWNIRNFDDNRFGNGRRTREDLYYIAEIVSRFDILAVQEICDDLGPLDDLMGLLGRDYDYIMTDVTDGPSGNRERLGFIYDRDKVKFKGIAGELVLADRNEIVDGDKRRQFARTPFMCYFQSGWFKFMFSTVHIYYGEKTGVKYKRRVSEIESVASFLAERAKKEQDREGGANYILVGDFNIEKPGSDGDNALAKAGFKTVRNRKGSNANQTSFYDQISFLAKEGELQLVGSGVFQYFDSIFRPEDFAACRDRVRQAVDEKIAGLQAELATETEPEKVRKTTADIASWQAVRDDDGKLAAYYVKEWRTFHASDHLPLWVELKIDFSADYLQRLVTWIEPPAVTPAHP